MVGNSGRREHGPANGTAHSPSPAAGSSWTNLLRELLACDDHHARAAATQQLRVLASALARRRPNSLRKSANDPNAIVRMEAAIAASYIGTKPAFEAMLDVLKHPREGAVAYAITCALGSHTLRPHWEGNPEYNIARLLKQAARETVIKEPTPTASEAQFDSQPNLKIGQDLVRARADAVHGQGFRRRDRVSRSNWFSRIPTRPITTS